MKLKHYTNTDLQALHQPRAGETKWADAIECIESLHDITKTKAKYILIGVPEEQGIVLNKGKVGAAKVWDAFLPYLCSLPLNTFTDVSKLALLGAIDFGIEGVDINLLDDYLAGIVEKVIASGKIPIIIGGGHNNAYPNIKGASKALNQKITVVNLDAHADLRTCDFRHSGNGFSFALQDELLEHYYAIGLHTLYNNQFIIDTIESSSIIDVLYYNEILYNPSELESFLSNMSQHINGAVVLEIDLDVIANFPSSASSMLGFQWSELLQLVYKLQHTHAFSYYHICEASIGQDEKMNVLVCKSLCYLVQHILKYGK